MNKQPGAMLTPLAISVLALLEERPMHPYEMYQTLLQRREDYLVKVRPGSLYHTVTRLAEQDMVHAEGIDRAGNRPERTTYRITESGTTALRTRVADIIRRPLSEFPMFPLAMSEAHNLPADEVIGLLNERIGWLDQNLTELDALHTWATGRQVPRRYWMVLEYLHVQAQAEANWLRRVVAELIDGSLAWEQFDADGNRIDADTSDLGPAWGSAVTDDALAEIRRSASSE
ncbi:PadR family transcriptional regulator [Nocardia sp. NPDC051570]|uniref:PadR family transcriptional regulator n=1 Tax=Nocardia sp. NPDC051570 TaxID=3364324 RepID=UPI0037B8BAF1